MEDDKLLNQEETKALQELKTNLPEDKDFSRDLLGFRVRNDVRIGIFSALIEMLEMKQIKEQGAKLEDNKPNIQESNDNILEEAITRPEIPFIIDIFINEIQEEATTRKALSLLYGTEEAPTKEEVNTFLETLTPSKVRAILPQHELTPQEEAVLQYTKEERKARRYGTEEEAQAAAIARRNRAKAFISTLQLWEAIPLLIKGTGGSRYNTFTPTPAAENENYSMMSTSQFFRVTREVINLANFDEAARRINRRKKKKAAQSGTNKQGETAIQVREPGGGMTLAVSAGTSLEKIAENGQKEFDYIIGQIYKRVYDTEREQLKPGVIAISDNDLTNYKVCGTDNKTVNRRNFLNFLTFLSECKGAALTVTKKEKKKGEPKVTIDKLDIVPLFKRISIKRGGIYELVPNDQFNWPSALKYYTYLPLSAFTLSGRAYQTLNAILQKARISVTDRQDPAEVNITLMEIADLLRLPINTSETKRLIKTPIRNIINEINEIVTDISLSLEADEEANKAEYLTGSIRATFSGDLLQSFETLKNNQERNYKKQLAKHNRAISAQKQREANAAAKAKAGGKQTSN